MVYLGPSGPRVMAFQRRGRLGSIVIYEEDILWICGISINISVIYMYIYILFCGISIIILYICIYTHIINIYIYCIYIYVE